MIALFAGGIGKEAGDDEESTLGTNPLVADTDGGGLTDYEETHDEDWRATDPLNPADDMPSYLSVSDDDNLPIDESTGDNQTNQDDPMSTSEFLYELAKDSAALGGGLACVPFPPVDFAGLVLLEAAVVFAFCGFVAQGVEIFSNDDSAPSNEDTIP